MDGQDGAQLDIYLTLLAIGWIDGHLDESERTLIMRAAARDGLGSSDLARLEDAAHWPVSFEDTIPALSLAQSRYVYAMGSLIARLDGVVEPVEEAALDAFAQVLGIGPHDRERIDALVLERVRSASDLSAFEPDELRADLVGALG